MTWACDLSHDAAYNLHLSYFQYKLIFIKSTNSAYLFKYYHPQAYKAQIYKVCLLIAII